MRISASSSAVANAANWLREYKKIPWHLVVHEEFEEYFNCKVIVQDDPITHLACTEFVEFEDEKNAVMFLLRWS